MGKNTERAAVDQGIAGIQVGAIGNGGDIAEVDRRGSARRMGILPKSLMSPTTALTDTMCALSAIVTLPDGLTWLPLTRAATRSSGDSRKERNCWGSTRIKMVRASPPNEGGADTPRRLDNSGRTRNVASSWI